MSRHLVSISILLTLLLLGAVLSPVLAQNVDPVGSETAVYFQEDTETADSNINLLDGLGVVFAVISVYVVTMFTMAIGTEILVDIIKGFLGKPFGLKKRPNVREKLAEYEEFLPGTLDQLGVSAEARLKLERQVEDLKDVLEPAFTAEAAANHFRRSEMTAAFDTIGIDWSAADAIDKVKTTVEHQIDRAVANIDISTTLGQTVQRALETSDLVEKANRAIDRAAKRAEYQINPDTVYDAVSFVVSGEIADGVTSWTSAYLNSMQHKSYEVATSLYENQLKPQIQGFELGETLQNKIESQFENFLDNLRTYRKTDIYLLSLNNFLGEVENQRNIVRSTAGKIRDWFIDQIKKLLRLIPFIQHPRLTPINYDPLIGDSSTAAAKLLDLEEYDKEQNKKRIRRIRLLSFILGTALAYLMQVDSADLLADLFPNNSEFLDLTLIPGSSFLLSWIPRVTSLTEAFDLSAGILLTGLAASAGSTFWHDQLSRLQAAKKGVEQVQQVLQPIVMQTSETGTNGN
ncbi:MAG: hypothetical protein AAF490_21990 [Chloroflexota bacterium]